MVTYSSIRASLDLSAIDQHIIPSADSSYNLGSPTHKWKDMYLSGGTLHVGGVVIKEDVANPGKIVFEDSAGSTAFSTSGSLEAIASGALANGDTVIINPDGTVSAVGIDAVTQAVGPESIFEQSAISVGAAVTYDANAQKVVVVYRKAGGIWAAVGTVSGETISFGTSVQVSTLSSAPKVVYDSNAQKVVVIYDHYAKVGTISGTSISFGLEADWDPWTFSSYLDIAYDTNAQKIAIQYKNGGPGNDYGTVVIGTVSGTTISFGTPVVYLSRITNHGGIAYDANAQKLVIGYSDVGASGFTYYGTAVVGTISGTSISFGSPTIFNSNSTWYINPVYDSIAQKIVIAYRDNADTRGKAIVGTVSGTSISFGTAVTFETGATDWICIGYNPDLGKIVIAYRDDSNLDKGTVIAGTVSGTSITFESAVVFDGVVRPGDLTDIAYDANAQRFVIVYSDQDNSFYGTAVVFRNSTPPITNLGSENYIGISDGVYSDTAVATIQTVGSINTAQSGLIAGQSYYVQTDGTLNTIPDTPSVFAGTSVSSNKIIIKG